MIRSVIEGLRILDQTSPDEQKDIMGTILLIILILMLIGAAPVYPYSRDWGYGPSGGLGTIFMIVLILVLLGRI